MKAGAPDLSPEPESEPRVEKDCSATFLTHDVGRLEVDHSTVPLSDSKAKKRGATTRTTRATSQSQCTRQLAGSPSPRGTAPRRPAHIGSVPSGQDIYNSRNPGHVSSPPKSLGPINQTRANSLGAGGKQRDPTMSSVLAAEHPGLPLAVHPRILEHLSTPRPSSRGLNATGVPCPPVSTPHAFMFSPRVREVSVSGANSHPPFSKHRRPQPNRLSHAQKHFSW